MIPKPTDFGAHGRPPRNYGCRPPRPPELSLPVILLVALALMATALAQISIPTLPITTTLPALNASTGTLDITFPSTSSLYITLSICSLNTNTTQIPLALVSTSPVDFNIDDGLVPDRDSGGTDRANRRQRGGGLWSLSWDKGFANWTNPSDDSLQGQIGMRIGFVEGQSIADGNVVIELRASNQEPPTSVLESSLYLGDTTSSQVLLFSPLLLSAPQTQPTYPNYTLPPAQMDLPALPEFNLPTFDLVIVPTTASPTNQALDQSWCAVQQANISTGSVARTDSMVVNGTTTWSAMNGEEGYRTYWVVGGLLPATNYTAWYTQDDGTLSQPIWFTTKQSSFPCQLVLPNTYCPSIGYASPLEANSTSVLSSPAPIASLPDTISSLLTASLDAFATSLLTKACGRDFYSHVSSCLDCHTAYRDWACRSLIPRCADASLTDSLPPDIIPPRTVTRTVSSSSTAAYDYDQLLPCLGVCNAVDRTCPAFVLFTCPQREVNANETYGFFGKDDAEGDGSASSGSIARSSDRWGNRWCNGP